MIDLLEARRLFSFVPTGASTINGDRFQSVDKIVPLAGGGYVAAGLFSGNTKFTSGNEIDAGDDTDVFLQLVNGSTHATLGIGTDSGNRLKFVKDRVDFAATPARVDDNSFPLGVSSEARRGDEYVTQMKLGPDGKLYVAIAFKRDITLDMGNSKARTLHPDDDFEKEFFDSAILRYSISGGKFTLEDVKQIGGPFNDVIDDFTFDNTGNLLIAGSFERDCDFDPTSKIAIYEPDGRGDAFIAKYGRSGKLQWVSQFGGDTTVQPELEAAFSVVPSSDDGVFVGGTFAGGARFGVNGGESKKEVAKADDATDGFTMRLDDNGKLTWVEVQGGSDYDGIRAVTPAPDGGVYSVGYFENDADVDPRPDSEQIFSANDNDSHHDTPTDLFFTRFDGEGNVLRVKQLSGEGAELIASASTTSGGDLVIAGSFYGKFDIDPSSKTHLLTTPDSDNDDPNVSSRDQAYSGFVAVYSSGAKLRDVQQIDGLNGQDVFITGAQLGSDDQLAIAGRYRGGYTADDVTVRTNTDFHDYREDGFSLVFNAGLDTIE